MYIVNLINGDREIPIHAEQHHISEGKIVKGINLIDSFSFSILPMNPGFDEIFDYRTLVNVYNTATKRFEFYGRCLYSSTNMDESGEIVKDVVCESYLGFLNDTVQPYVNERNWTVRELLEFIITHHNKHVEPYKQFTLGEVTVTDPNDNLFLGVQRETTWKTLKDKLIDKLGGEIQFRVVDNKLILDYVPKLGTTKTTTIEVSKNMQSVERENDPTAFISRLIPLGAKIKDEEGNDTEQRLDIKAVNNDVEYIESPEAVKAFGIKYDYVIFDDLNTAALLLKRGQEYLAENNKIQIKYSINALDLSLLGLEIDGFELYNSYPIINPYLGINDTARVIKKTIDIVNPFKSSIEIGDNFKTLSDIQLEQDNKFNDMFDTVGKIESDYVTNKEFKTEAKNTSSLIQQSIDNILLTVKSAYTSKTSTEELRKNLESQIKLLEDQINLKFTSTEQKIENVNGELSGVTETISKYFTFTINGVTIGQSNSPFKVIIDNDELVMTWNGVEIIRLDPDDVSTVPSLSVNKMFNLFGFVAEEDADGCVNWSYEGGD